MKWKKRGERAVSTVSTPGNRIRAANDTEGSREGRVQANPGLHPLCSVEWEISAFTFILAPTQHSLLLVFLTSQGQNQANPPTQSLSKFYVFKMDHRTRRYLKEMTRDEISDTHNDREGHGRPVLGGSRQSCCCPSPCL